MLGHPTGAKMVAIAAMRVKIILTNHGMLAGKHPGAPRSPDTIVGRGGGACKFPLALLHLLSLPTCSYVDVVQRFDCSCDFCGC
jgi:hypothetical protein